MRRPALALILASLTAHAAWAQDPATPAPPPDAAPAAPDWDVIERDGSLIATVAYDPGLIVGVRCRAWDL
ncbi:MAG: hypothetical protein EON88_25160, partial [Brevundimonas sp.]